MEDKKIRVYFIKQVKQLLRIFMSKRRAFERFPYIVEVKDLRIGAKVHTIDSKFVSWAEPIQFTMRITTTRSSIFSISKLVPQQKFQNYLMIYQKKKIK